MNGVGDESCVEGSTCALYLLLTRTAARFLHNSLVASRQLLIPNSRPGRRDGKVQSRGGRPRPKWRLGTANRRHHPGGRRVTMFRVRDRELHDVSEPPRSEVSEEQHPRVERSRYTCGKQTHTWDEIEASLAKCRDRRATGRRTLTAYDEHLLATLAPHKQDQLTRWPVQVRLDYLQRQAASYSGIKGVSTALKHRHRDA